MRNLTRYFYLLLIFCYIATAINIFAIGIFRKPPFIKIINPAYPISIPNFLECGGLLLSFFIMLSVSRYSATLYGKKARWLWTMIILSYTALLTGILGSVSRVKSHYILDHFSLISPNHLWVIALLGCISFLTCFRLLFKAELIDGKFFGNIAGCFYLWLFTAYGLDYMNDHTTDWTVLSRLMDLGEEAIESFTVIFFLRNFVLHKYALENIIFQRSG